MRRAFAVFARTVQRLRSSEIRRGRGRKLRLDTLETRVQPGSVLSGMVSGTVTDPLASTGLTAGDGALPAKTDSTSTPAAPVRQPQAPAEPIAWPPTNSAVDSRRAEAWGRSDTNNSDLATDPATLDLSDLSFPDPNRFAVPVLAAGGPAADTSAGQPAAPAISSPDVPAPADGPAPFAPGNSGPPGDLSVAPPAPDSAPQFQSPAPARRAKAPAASSTDAGPGPLMPAVVREAPDRAAVRTADGRAAVELDAHGYNLGAVTATRAAAAGAALPFGLFGFNVTGLAPGAIATVDLTLPAGARPDGYYKQDPATGELTRFNFDGHTGAVVHGNMVTLYLQDGGRGDADGVANGVVVDPGGPGEDGSTVTSPTAPDTSPPPSDTGGGTGTTNPDAPPPTGTGSPDPSEPPPDAGPTPPPFPDGDPSELPGGPDPVNPGFPDDTSSPPDTGTDGGSDGDGTGTGDTGGDGTGTGGSGTGGTGDTGGTGGDGSGDTGGTGTGGDGSGGSGGTGDGDNGSGQQAQNYYDVTVGQTLTISEWNVTVTNGSWWSGWTGTRTIRVTRSDSGSITLAPVDNPTPGAPAEVDNQVTVTGLNSTTPTVTWSGQADRLWLITNGEVKDVTVSTYLNVWAGTVSGTIQATDGWVDIWGGYWANGTWLGTQSVDATVSGRTGVAVAADSLDGSFTSEDGTVGLYSAEALDLDSIELSAKTGVYASSAATVTGKLSPNHGPAAVYGVTGVDLTISGAQELTAAAWNGDLKLRASGELDHANVALSAGGKVDFEAEGDARVGAAAGGDIRIQVSGDLEVRGITATGDVSVQAGSIQRTPIPDPDSPGSSTLTGGAIRSYSKSVVLDADTSIETDWVWAGTNLWVAARDGDLQGSFDTIDGWAYLWALGAVRGSVWARQSASVTAFGDLDATVTSQQDDVDVYSGGDVKKSLTANRDLTVDAVGGVNGELIGRDVTVSAGGDLTKNVTASGAADLSVAGNLTASFVFATDSLDVAVNGDIVGTDPNVFPMLSAGADATVWAGGKITDNVNGASADVTAVGPISGNVRGLTGEAHVWTGDALTGNVTASGNAVIEAVGDINSQMSGGMGVTAVSNGAISGSATADWVVDLRAGTTAESATVSTRKSQNDWNTDADSPRQIRLTQLAQEIADQQQTVNYLSGTSGGSDAYNGALQRLQALQGEQALLQSPPTLDRSLDNIPADRVLGMVNDGTAQTFDGTYEGASLTGYVVLSDAVPGRAYTVILAPYYVTPGETDDDGFYHEPEERSLVGAANWRSLVQYFKEVRRTYEDPTATRDTAVIVTDLRKPENAIGFLQSAILSQQAERLDFASNLLEFAVNVIPLVSTADHLAKGEYWEAGFSFVGDVASITGIGAGLKAVVAGRNCMVAGKKVLSLARVAQIASVADGSLGAVRIGQGLYALGKGNTADAWGYFGDATLRLLGLAGAAKYLRTKPLCFVAGTPVHTDGGLRPIEDVRPGDRVWAFDRQAQAWALCPVERAFERTSDRLATIRLAGGTELTGTDGHPVWVIEGEGLATRPHGDHGADEPAGPTPGRWVALAALRVGDVVLTRLGRAARVVSVDVRAAAVPVYNFEVGRLHSYAVGAAGVLVHNSENYQGNIKTVVQEAAAQPNKPTVTKTAARAEHTPAGGGSAAMAEAPPSRTTTPSTDAPTPSRHYRNRPRSNQDDRVSYRWEADGPVVQTDLLSADTEALRAELDAVQAAKSATKAEKDAAGEALGTKGADQYMTTRVGAEKKYVQQSANGNFDLDAVYQKGDTLYVVEAKGPSARETGREVPNETTVAGLQAYSMEGSRRYLQDTAQAMSQDINNAARAEWGSKVLDGLRDNKVVYLMVAVRPHKDGTAYFSVKRYKLN